MKSTDKGERDYPACTGKRDSGERASIELEDKTAVNVDKIQKIDHVPKCDFFFSLKIDCTMFVVCSTEHKECTMLLCSKETQLYIRFKCNFF